MTDRSGSGNAELLSAHRSRAAEILRSEGSYSLSMRILRKLISPFAELGSVVFFVRDLEGEAPRALSTSEVTLRPVSPSEVPRLLLRPDAGTREVRDAVEASLRRGDRYFVAFDGGGEPTHGRWVTHERVRIPELAMDFVPGAEGGYFYDGHTVPRFRRQGIDGLMRCFIFETLRAEGRRRAYSYVRGDNPAGIKAALKWQRRLGTVRYVKLRGLRPIVLGTPRGPLAALLRRRDGTAARVERADQKRAWHAWFEGWLKQPLEKRSTGYHAQPEEYFDSAAAYVVAALRLDPVADFVLDLGCDSAMLTRFIAPRCLRLVGADYIPGQIADAVRLGSTCASGRRSEFLAADARHLPFPAGVFTKAYCTGTIHTLSSHEDALRVIHELVRVCGPGGEVLLGALPARSKRAVALRRAWKEAGLVGRLRIAGGLAIPRSIKSPLGRLLPSWRSSAIVSLVFDLEELKAALERSGLQCRIEDFPADYFSDDFRETRSNLLIRIPV